MLNNISQLTAAGNLGELAKAAYGNRYGKEEKMAGQPMSTEEASAYSEGEIVLRQERDRWVITGISEPHYDEFKSIMDNMNVQKEP